MVWNKRIRQFHRWMSITFTVIVIACFVAVAQDDPAAWIFYLPLPPLFLLLFSGLYLFALPYLAKRRTARA